MGLFKKTAQDGLARSGLITTAHSTIETPCFMPVGTNASVKAISYTRLADMNYRILLANMFHLLAKGGIDYIRASGSLHAFTAWDRAFLTDSGGYQIYSLGALTKKSDEGVVIKSPWNGDRIALTPESITQLQIEIGVDIAMCLDDCIGSTQSPQDHQVAVARTTEWAKRAKRISEQAQSQTALFGIIQGGLIAHLRKQSLEEMVSIGFSGYALGGLAVGESRAQRMAVLSEIAPLLPEHAPRYVMGIGTPVDIVDAVYQGVDLFDCVIPTRNARNGYVFTSGGIIRIKNAQYKSDHSPLDSTCSCRTCQVHSRSYLQYLFKHQERNAAALLTEHNLFYYAQLCRQMREAIAAHQFKQFRTTILSRYQAEDG